MTLQQLKEKYDGMSYTEIRKLVVSGVLMYTGEGSERGYISKKLSPDDIKAVSVNTLHHRVSLTYEAKIAGESIDTVIYSNVLKAKVPMV